jgi:hypothetical protein|tara:strand:+ start:671 stop:1267 length:597 start_codon:yes stop_codon:yes gene_type:complete
MLKFKDLIESKKLPDGIRMYHGGKKWYSIPTELQPSYKGRYEHGVGIYTTNFWQTASKYAKGSRVIHFLVIDKNYTDIRDVIVSKDEILKFVSDINFKNKKQLIKDINSYLERRNTNELPLNILNNLIVNNESGSGKSGVELTKFFIKHGGDVSLVNMGGDEYYIIIFNPKIIKYMEIIKPDQIGKFPYEFELNNSYI